MNLENYYLDLDKVFKLKEESIKYIQSLYDNMLLFNFDGRQEIAKSYFNTLSQSGYLTNIRNKKLDELLDE